MIENNSNPESGIDQFLAQQVASTPQTNEELVIALATLRGELVVKEQQLASMRNSRDNYQAMYTKVNTFIQNSIDNGDWTDEELEEIFWEELSELLDLSIKQEVEVTITAYWRATLTLPRGKSINEVADHISIDDPELNHNSFELTEVDCRDISVENF
jgi:hypothetical protein